MSRWKWVNPGGPEVQREALEKPLCWGLENTACRRGAQGPRPTSGCPQSWFSAGAGEVTLTVILSTPEWKEAPGGPRLSGAGGGLEGGARCTLPP